MLRVTRQAADPAGEIASLIHDSFAASEGPAEGARVGRLAAALLAGPAPPAKAFLAREGDALVGAVLFSPLAFSDDPRRVLLLSPMAVATVVSMIVSLALLGAALRTLPLGTAYAVWTGIGTVGSAILGMALFGEAASVARLVCIGLIVAGIVGLKLTASH